MNIKISPEELNEHAQNIVKNVNSIKEKLNNVKTSIDSLSSWQSSSKDLYVSKVQSEMATMNEMVEAIESYGLVARDVAARVMGVEASISETIMKNMDSNA